MNVQQQMLVSGKEFTRRAHLLFNLRFLNYHNHHHYYRKLQKFSSNINNSANLRYSIKVIPDQQQQTRHKMKKSSENFDIDSIKQVVDLDCVKRLASLESLGSDRFRSRRSVSGNPLLVPGRSGHKNVYGGLLFAHSVLAAEMTVATPFFPHAAHSFFVRTATIEQPIDYVVTRLRDGRSFSTRLVQAIQDGQVVFCSQVSLCTPERSAIEHQTEMPTVPPPEELKSELDLSRVMRNDYEKGKINVKKSVIDNIKRNVVENQVSIFEFRPTEPNLYMSLEQHSMVPARYWLKCNVPLRGSRTDSSLNRFLLGFITDASMISTAIRPHTTYNYQPSLLTTLDHTVHYHDGNFFTDDWLLCENVSTVAKNGRAYTLGRIWTRDGRLVLSCSQESLCRTLPDKPVSKL